MANKRLIALIVLFSICILSFSACKSDDTLISSDLIMIEDNEMISSEVVTGNLAKSVKCEAASFYPITADISPEKSGVILVDVKVKNLDYVKKGDLLAELRPYTDEEIAEKENDIAAKEAELSTKMAYYDNEKNSLNSMKAATSNSIEKSIYDQKIIENDLNRDYAYSTATAEIETMKKELEVIKSVEGNCNIYAPFDGVVEAVRVSNEGTVLSSSTIVFDMYSVDTVIVYFDDPGNVYYNNKVIVTAGQGEDKQVIEGTVVGADHYINPDMRQGKVFVRLEGDYDKENLESLSVELTTYNVQNVLITRSSGISKIKDESYVYILEDEKLKRRHVITGGSDDENTWILQGIEEGDVVYLQ